MPVIAVFFGIIIRMYYREHEPRHFYFRKFFVDGGTVAGGRNVGV